MWRGVCVIGGETRRGDSPVGESLGGCVHVGRVVGWCHRVSHARALACSGGAQNGPGEDHQVIEESAFDEGETGTATASAKAGAPENGSVSVSVSAEVDDAEGRVTSSSRSTSSSTSGAGSGQNTTSSESTSSSTGSR